MPRFLVATDGDDVVGCGELARLSPAVAEVRSLVVEGPRRGTGVGRRLLEALIAAAVSQRFPRLCAFTHQARPFVRAGFSIVPHPWVPAKIAADCPDVRPLSPLPPVRRRARPEADGRSLAMTAPSITRADGGITAPEGYRAAGVACGLKPAGLDVALVVADDVASAAGLFTTNLAVAAPVVVSREQLARSGGHARAIAVNSKCANACTGADGMQAARAMAAATAEAVGCDPAHVLIRVDRRHRDASRHNEGERRYRRGGAAPEPRRAPGGGRGDHDDRHLPQGGRGPRRDAGGALHHRRHGEGRRDDRAEPGHDARVPDHRRRRRSRDPRPRAPRGGAGHIQLDHRGRRAVDQRHGPHAGQRGEPRRRRPDGRIPLFWPASTSCAPGSRGRSCAAARAPPSS